MRELEFYEQQYSVIFPPSWRMPQYISEEFAILTREQMIGILETSINEIGVKILMEAMKATIKFELDLCSKFAQTLSSNPSSPPPSSHLSSLVESSEEDEAENITNLNPFSPEALKIKWKKEQQRRLKEESVTSFTFFSTF